MDEVVQAQLSVDEIEPQPSVDEVAEPQPSVDEIVEPPSVDEVMRKYDGARRVTPQAEAVAVPVIKTEEVHQSEQDVASQKRPQ